ncbi:MAG: hypothetical protein ACC645_19990, partial [Pirellulales bacterium]
MGHDRQRTRRWRLGMCLAILALQTLLVVATLTLLAHVRAWAIHEMATSRGRQQWNAWREAAELQANGSG